MVTMPGEFLEKTTADLQVADATNEWGVLADIYTSTEVDFSIATESNLNLPSAKHELYTFDVVYLVFLIATLVIGNIGNVMVIGAVISHKPLRKECNIFILNLAVADLCVTAFVDPFSVLGTIGGPQFFHDRSGLCHVIGSVCLVSCVCSLWSIAAISVNRYILLCRQALYHRIFTWKRTVGIAIALWVGAFLLDIPNFVEWGDHAYDMKTMACSYDRTESYSYTVFFIVWFVTIPLLTVFFCNINIYIVVLKSKIRVAAHQNSANPQPGQNEDESTAYAAVTGMETQQLSYISEDKTITTTISTREKTENELKPTAVAPQKKHTRKPKIASRSMKAEVKLAKTLFIIFIVFCIAWAPYAILCLYDKKDTIPKEAYAISILMAHGSSTINSILYAFTNKSFRDGYKCFLMKCGFKCFEIN